jgi:hypothetical protein
MSLLILRIIRIPFRFVIGREKDVANSEILRLIQQSLQMDQERNEMSRALQHHHDTYNERHMNDAGFVNIEPNEQDTIIDNSLDNNHQQLAKTHEKNYEVIVYCMSIVVD